MPKRTLSGKRILVFGASMGLGYELAVAFAKRGASVLAAARSTGLLETLARQVRSDGGVIETYTADVTVPEHRQAVLDFQYQCYGGIDILVYAVGTATLGFFMESSDEVLRHLFEVNFFSMAELTRLCLPQLAHGDQPLFVTVSSVLGRSAEPCRAEYSASKAAIHGLCDAMRAELAPYGISVLTVNPGAMQTNSSRGLSTKTNATWRADEAAASIVHAMERNMTELTLGIAARWNIFTNRFFPGLRHWWQSRQWSKRYALERSMMRHRLDRPRTTDSNPMELPRH